MKDVNNSKFVAALRTDGLGIRLLAMMNAIALSDGLSVPFRFSWDERAMRNPFHSVASLGEMFSHEFIESHFVKDVSEWTQIRFADLLDEEVSEGYFNCPQRIDRNLKGSPKAMRILRETDFRLIFSKIGFSRDVCSIMKEVERLNVPAGAIGVHLRAGDIVYGQFRQNPRYIDKVLPFPIALDLIGELASRVRVIVFSQDESLANFIKSRLDVAMSSEWMPSGLNAYQKAIFDISLMARCSKIYGGSSGFSEVANRISGVEVASPLGSEDPERVVERIISAISDDAYRNVPPMQVAYACVQAVLYGWRFLSHAQSVDLVTLARDYDHDNVFLDFLELLLHLNNGDPSAANRLLENMSDIQVLDLKSVVRRNFGATTHRKTASRLGFDATIFSWAERCWAAGQLAEWAGSRG